MRIRIFLLPMLVVAIATILTGCGGGISQRGPISLDNVIKDFPPRIRSAALSGSGSLLTVNFQPFDGELFPGGDGWFLRENEEFNSRVMVNFFLQDLGPDTSGQKLFRVNPPIPAGFDAFFPITVTDPPEFGEARRKKTEIVHVVSPRQN